MASSDRPNRSAELTLGLMNKLDKYKNSKDLKEQAKFTAGFSIIMNIMNANNDYTKINSALQSGLQDPIIKKDKELSTKFQELSSVYAFENTVAQKMQRSASTESIYVPMPSVNTVYVPMPSVNTVKEHEKKPTRTTAQEMHALMSNQPKHKQTLPKMPTNAVNDFIKLNNASKGALPKKPANATPKKSTASPQVKAMAAPAAKITGSSPVGAPIDLKGKREVKSAINHGKVAPQQAQPLPPTPGIRPEVPKVSPPLAPPPKLPMPDKPLPTPQSSSKGSQELSRSKRSYGNSAESARDLPPAKKPSELAKRKDAAVRAKQKDMIPETTPKMSTKIRK